MHMHIHIYIYMSYTNLLAWFTGNSPLLGLAFRRSAASKLRRWPERSRPCACYRLGRPVTGRATGVPHGNPMGIPAALGVESLSSRNGLFSRSVTPTFIYFLGWWDGTYSLTNQSIKINIPRGAESHV